MKEKLVIEITGKHWEDIINLPCFRELAHYQTWSVLLSVSYVNGAELNSEDEYYGERAAIGDFVVQYDNGKWGLIRI